MSIGSIQPCEIRERTDPDTGRRLRQLTAARANSYPLYYFTPSVTPDGRFLVFHSERSGWVQLHRLDLRSGEIVQLSDGRTDDSGWAIWCEPHLRGIYNHLSALNGPRREAYYFQDGADGELELRCTALDDLANRVVLRQPGRLAIGQSGCSPRGHLFAFIHADRDLFEARMRAREALTNMGQFGWAGGHNEWRNQVPCTIGVVDTASGAYRDVVELDFHVHHVIFVDDDTLLVNHVRDDSGMWTVKVDGSGQRPLRPRDDGGAICHQVVTERGIYYEANAYPEGERVVRVGRCDPHTGAFDEVHLPEVGYVHTGCDPAGRFLFYEDQQPDGTHRLLAIHHPRDPARFRVEVLRQLPPIGGGQRHHAHPFLAAADRRWLYHTEVVDGFAQICALDVADRVDGHDYWDDYWD